jgi:uncharacterized protein
VNWLKHFLVVALLAACAAAPQPAPVVDAPARPVPPDAPAPPPPADPEAQTAPLNAPPPAIVAIPLPGTTAPAPANRHIALILPINSQSFGAAADAVQDGFTAAAARSKNALPIKVYPTGDKPEEVLSAYSQGVQAGAQVAVGPLTRNGVSTLATSGLVNIPTLALNWPDREIVPPQNFYLLGLQVEAEAKQAAQLAWSQGARNAVTVYGDTALYKRVNQAFADEWLRLGGTIANTLRLSADPEQLLKLREAAKTSGADAIFLALDAKRARIVRPYLDSQLPTYATSHVYSGRGEAILNHDLNGIRFIDSPWLVQSDHPAVMVYPHSDFPLSAELDRLYALGIDAFRIAEMLVAGTQPATLDGVVGRITLNRANQFERELTPAIIRQGEAVSLERVKR